MDAREALRELTATVCRCKRGDQYNRALQSQRECEAVETLSRHISTTLLIELEAQELLGLARKPGEKSQRGCSHAELMADVIDAYGSVGMEGVCCATKAAAKQ